MMSLIIAVLIVLFVSGLASGTEAAIFTVSYTKVRTFIDQGKPGAKALLKIQEEIRRTIATIVIINNIANIVGSITVGSMAIKILGSEMLGIFSTILTFLIIIISEIIPKTLGEQYSDKWSLITARPVLWLSRIFTPIIFIIEQVLKPFTHKYKNPITSEEEIKVMAHLGQKEGIIEKEEGIMIQRVFRLNDIKAEDLMTARSSVDMIDSTQNISTSKKIAFNSVHSRLPIYKNSIDNIIGIVHQRELLKELSTNPNSNKLVSALAHPAVFVPRSIPADDLLERFQKEHSHLAVVVEDNGDTAGVVSLEDVLEELVGEIIDETDKEEQLIKKISETELIADRQADVHHINDLLHIHLSGQGNLSQLITEKVGKIPKQGETIEIDGVKIVITEATPKQILKTHITKTNP